MENFIEVSAIQINQPLDSFFACKIAAKDLLEITFSDPIRYENGKLTGGQRLIDPDRIKEIKDYVEGQDTAFPNSIILSANYDEDGFNCQDVNLRWRFENGKLIVPQKIKLASIIDGQHRLYGFKNANSKSQQIELLCSVYLDLPNPLQAQLFATINSTQRKVDKSLAYEQFGFNIDNEKNSSWSPDKLAISLYKKLNSDVDSPFYGHIKVAPQMDEFMMEKFKDSKWLVSTATIVDGIIRLVSTSPKKDKYELQKIDLDERSRNKVLKIDNSPLRILYLQEQDLVIYKIVCNFFNAAKKVLFSNAANDSTIVKTVGIQGLFDVLKRLINSDINNAKSQIVTDDEEVNIFSIIKAIDFSEIKYVNFLSKVENVNFGDKYFQFSGVGKARITNIILFANNMIEAPQALNPEMINDNDKLEKNASKITEYELMNSLISATS